MTALATEGDLRARIEALPDSWETRSLEFAPDCGPGLHLAAEELRAALAQPTTDGGGTNE